VRKQLHGVLSKVKDTLDNEPKQQPQANSLATLFGGAQPLWLTVCSSGSGGASRSNSGCRSSSSSLGHLSLGNVLGSMLQVQHLDVHAW
jgi:hypothetical protein